MTTTMVIQKEKIRKSNDFTGGGRVLTEMVETLFVFLMKHHNGNRRAMHMGVGHGDK